MVFSVPEIFDYEKFYNKFAAFWEVLSPEERGFCDKKPDITFIESFHPPYAPNLNHWNISTEFFSLHVDENFCVIRYVRRGIEYDRESLPLTNTIKDVIVTRFNTLLRSCGEDPTHYVIDNIEESPTQPLWNLTASKVAHGLPMVNKGSIASFYRYDKSLFLFCYDSFGSEDIATSPTAITENQARILLSRHLSNYLFTQPRHSEGTSEYYALTEFVFDEITAPCIRLCIFYPNYHLSPLKQEALAEKVGNPMFETDVQDYFDARVSYEIKTDYRYGIGGCFIDKSGDLLWDSDIKRDDYIIFRIHGYIDAHTGEYLGGSHWLIFP